MKENDVDKTDEVSYKFADLGDRINTVIISFHKLHKIEYVFNNKIGFTIK